jgi:hypothetical protein
MKDHRRFKDNHEERPRTKGQRQRYQFNDDSNDEETIDLRMLRNRDVDDLLELIESTQSK